jgi:hypothetical protein
MLEALEEAFFSLTRGWHPSISPTPSTGTVKYTPDNVEGRSKAKAEIHSVRGTGAMGSVRKVIPRKVIRLAGPRPLHLPAEWAGRVTFPDHGQVCSGLSATWD